MSVPEDEERLLPLAQRWPRASKFLLSGCAATVAELATFPLDLTKTRLQMQGEAALARLGDGARESAPYRGMVRTALGIVQEEGFLKLWQGVTPAIYRHVVYSGGRMVTYEHLREVVFGKSEDKHYPLWKSVIGGMMAGVVGQFLANPTDLVKVQMQMEGKRKLEGKPLRFRGVHHAFAKILSEGGIRGLWAGWVPNIQRAALVNMGDLTTYDTVKHYLVLNTPLEDNITTHGLSSLCSGLVASILGTPADVIKSRIMNQPRDKQGRSSCRETKLLRSLTKTNLVTQYQDSVGNKDNQMCPFTAEKKEESSAESPLKATRLEATLSERNIGDSCNKDLPLKFSELPQKIIMPGFKTVVYVSHINDLSDFYVQLTEDEAEITSLSERLNDVRTRPEFYSGPPLQRGDVTCAIFPEDSLWYRAVVREQQPNDLLCVQFIDYGNVSVVHTNKIGKLDLLNALVPALCIHCSLRGLWVPEILNCKAVTRYFSRRTDEVQIRCEFVQFQDRWEVILADEHGIIAEDMISRYAFSEKSQVGLSNQIIKGACSKSVHKTDIGTSLFLNWYNPKMKTIRAYATVIDGPEYFWCQFADTEKLQFLEVEVQTAGEQVTAWRSCVPCPHIGDPCIVRYREDGHYYRALITNICDDYLVSVRLVDFGNIEDCVDPKALWNIPSELLVVPMQAFPCCLSGFNISEGACPQEGNDYFYEIVTEDVLEITILEIKRDVCNIPLAIVDLKSKGESINQKMKKYSKIGISNSDLPYEKHDPEIKGALGSLSPEVGFKKPSSKAGQEKALYVESQTDELSERIEKDLNITEARPTKFYDPDTDNIFEAFENPRKDKIGIEVLEGKRECRLVDEAKFDDKYLMTGFNTSLPLQASETKETLELNSLEVPLSPDDESKEFLELESIELQHSLVGDEEKEPGRVTPLVPLPQGCDTEATLHPCTAQLPLNCESEKQPELELPTAQLCLDDKINPLSLRVGQRAQDPTCAEDTRKSSCMDCFDDQPRLPLHLHGMNCDPNRQVEMNIYKEEFTEYKSRDAISPLTLFSEEESRDGRKRNNALQDHVSAQAEKTYTLEGFAVGSKCVVWSSLRNTWSKCEILEIGEEGTKVLNLSNGMEEIVNPENVWNGIPKLSKSPSEKRGLEVI
ncbi:tudor domain-containing protein 6 isoform X2 [Leopardus geoffroyi]|nr:tudor domain-containing protein 6 isoform X2 [Leopardus geoffroyi]